ncbi:MAG: DNA polymerase III subunit gamma/tau, partial [Pseudonocardiaceae bacterium]
GAPPPAARPPAPAPAPAPARLEPAPEPAGEPTPATSGRLDAAAVRRVWQALLDAVREQSRAAQVLLSNATASAVEGDTLVLTLPTAPLARRLADERNTEMIKGALRTVLGVDWRVRCEHAGDPVPRGPVAQPQRARPAQPPPERPARQPVRRPSAPQRPAKPDDGIPPPPEPPDPADPPEPDPPEPDPDDPGPVPRFVAPPERPSVPPDDYEASMIAESVADLDNSRHRNPDEAALELLAEQLGARRIDS